MTALSVNINKIAVLRNSRGGALPDVATAAAACVHAGADGITVHPRPDGRHIRHDDVLTLAESAARHGVELNLEGNPFAPPRPGYPGFLALCERARPAQATLVPDGDSQLTSDHGFDFQRDADSLRPLVQRLKALGCRVSLFADAGSPVEYAARIGADRIELYTGPYARAAAAGDAQSALDACRRTAAAAQAVGLGVNAGHDLNQANLGGFLAAVPGILEVSIGHALIAEALYAGLETTITAYLRILRAARG